MEGNLGAGKTTLVKGLAKALGIKKNITSPTFALMNIYECPAKKTKQKFDTKLAIKKLAHIDTYRLKNEEELIDIGIEDYLGAPDTLCVIEWPERITGLLKNKKIKKIRIEHAENNERILAVKK